MSREATPFDSSVNSPSSTPVWRIAAPVTAAVLIGVLLLYWETVVFTVDFWSRRRAYGHGLLLVPISLFMIWHGRAAFARLAPRPQPWIAPLLLAASLVWALAWFIDVQLGMQLVLLAIIGLVAWMLLGNRAGRLLAMPVGYLLLGIPVWSLLTPYLQGYTAEAAARILSAVGVPVYLEAIYISIPAGQFVVEEVCAGLRYLLATMSIAALYAYLNLRRVWLGILFFVSCIAFSILLNWLRVVIIIWVGHASGMQHWLVKDHLSFGWAMFALGLVPIFLYGVWLQRFDPIPPEEAPVPGGPARGAPPASRFALWGVIALALSSAGPAAVLWSTSRPAAPVAVDLHAPAPVAPWERAPDDDYPWHPDFAGADASAQAVYADGDARVSLYIAYYAHQREGAELVNELNVLYDGGTWRAGRTGERRVAVGADAPIRVREIELVAGTGERRLVWYWYRLGSRSTTSALEAKLLQLWETLTGAPQAAVVAVSAPVTPTLAATRTRLEAFLAAMTPAISRAAPP